METHPKVVWLCGASCSGKTRTALEFSYAYAETTREQLGFKLASKLELHAFYAFCNKESKRSVLVLDGLCLTDVEKPEALLSVLQMPFDYILVTSFWSPNHPLVSPVLVRLMTFGPGIHQYNFEVGMEVLCRDAKLDSNFWNLGDSCQ